MRSIIFLLLTIALLHIPTSYNCFPADSKVYKYFEDTSENKLATDEKIKKINIGDIKLNEWVITKDRLGEIQKTKVIGWTYYDYSIEQDYIEILWYPIGKNSKAAASNPKLQNSSDKILRISHEQLIFIRTKNGRQVKRAKNLAINDIIYLEIWVGVVKKTSVKKYKGKVTLQTTEGTFVVDEIQASSYDIFKNQEVSHYLFSYYEVFYNILPPFMQHVWAYTYFGKNLYSHVASVVLAIGKRFMDFDKIVDNINGFSNFDDKTTNKGFVDGLTFEDIKKKYEKHGGPQEPQLEKNNKDVPDEVVDL